MKSSVTFGPAPAVWQRMSPTRGGGGPKQQGCGRDLSGASIACRGTGLSAAAGAPPTHCWPARNEQTRPPPACALLGISALFARRRFRGSASRCARCCGYARRSSGLYQLGLWRPPTPRPHATIRPRALGAPNPFQAPQASPLLEACFLRTLLPTGRARSPARCF